MQLLILRKYDKEGTCGKLFIDGELFCRTLERPNLDNQQDNPKTKANDSSCIPEGDYTLIRDRVGRFKYFAVLDVPNRSNIELHPANSIDDLLGCLGAGEEIQENKYNYKFWLTKSKMTCLKLVDKLPEKCTLKITSEDSQCKN
jgi:hypothetical protein